MYYFSVKRRIRCGILHILHLSEYYIIKKNTSKTNKDLKKQTIKKIRWDWPNFQYPNSEVKNNFKNYKPTYIF